MAGMDHGNMGGSNATDDSIQATWKLSNDKPQSNQNVDISIQVNDKKW